MGPPATNHKPRFLWQGLLVVLPVVLLAAVGFLSLRQDRLLAESEATERARGVAGDLAKEMRLNLETLSEADQPEVHLFELDRAGHLVFPPSADPVPAPKPFDAALLGAEQARLWNKARALECDSVDPVKALIAWGDFLASRPPSNFVAAARYVMGLLSLKTGSLKEAAVQFQALSEDYPNAVGESGLPLRPLAQLKLLETANEASASKSSFENLCSNLVYRPTLLTPQLLQRTLELAKTPEGKETVRQWQTVWLKHQTSRELFEAAASQIRVTTNSDWKALWFISQMPVEHFASRLLRPFNLQTALEERNWLAVPQSGNAINCSFACRGEAHLGAVMSHLAGSKKDMPNYFGIGAEVEGKRLSLLAPDMRAWQTVYSRGAKEPAQDAKASSPQPGMKVLASASEGEPGQGQVKVTVYLTSPSALFQRQRTRTLWFGALIAASAFAALVGLLAAYRSFRRQLRLSELKSNFVSSVSHELRAPIASVRLMAESLERGKISDAPKQHEYFSFIVQECRRLSSLIENVLDFSRIDQGHKQYDLEPTDIVALAEKTVALMQAYAAERQVNLSLQLDGLPSSTTKPQPLADGKALQQALINLIDNALKHSPKGEKICVGLEVGESANPDSQPGTAGQWSNVHTSSPKSVLMLWVEDHGPGIPPQEHQKIFERFYRLGSELRRETPGVGIGLSIVKHIIEAHGGRVLIRSAVGEGSRFTLELPLNQNSYGTHPDH
jgi:signal transduction histidine kinase